MCGESSISAAGPGGDDGFSGPVRRAGSVEQRAPHDPADQPRFDLAAHSTRHRGRRRRRRLRHCVVGAQAFRPRLGNNELATVRAARGACGDEPPRRHHLYRPAVGGAGEHARLDGPAAHLSADGRDRPRVRLGCHQHRCRADQEPVRQPHRGRFGLDDRGAQHFAAARSAGERARLDQSQSRRPADHAARHHQGLGADGDAGVGGERSRQFPRQATARLRRSHAVDPGAAEQARSASGC